MHPALLDAALQLTRAVLPATSGAQLPFAFTDVRLYATGATELHVRADARDDGVRVLLTDGAGALVASVGALTLRPVTAGRLRAALSVPDLHRVVFRPVPDALPAEPSRSSCWAGARCPRPSARPRPRSSPRTARAGC
ncbi:polyketide synthase dehydratase domain-containing protein [Actinomadura keratinilytica]